MNRRGSFKTILGGLIAAATWIGAGCREVYSAVSRWGWPGYPKKGELRKHLKTSKNHPNITDAEVDAMSFEQMIKWHDADHKRRGDKGRFNPAAHVPGTDYP